MGEDEECGEIYFDTGDELQTIGYISPDGVNQTVSDVCDEKTWDLSYLQENAAKDFTFSAELKMNRRQYRKWHRNLLRSMNVRAGKRLLKPGGCILCRFTREIWLYAGCIGLKDGRWMAYIADPDIPLSSVQPSDCQLIAWDPGAWRKW